MLDRDDEDDVYVATSSRSRSPGAARVISSPVHPQPRGSLARSASWGTQEEDVFGSTARASPSRQLSFQPVNPPTRQGPPSLEVSGDWDGWMSMAGQINAQDLRHSAGSHDSGFDAEPMIKACVKVFVTQVTPSYAMPWARGEETRSTGSGFVVQMPSSADGGETHPDAAGVAPGARCILTNAHVVENFSLVQVRPAGSPDKYVARVLCIGHDVDLAVLLVPDESFWEGLPLVSLGTGLPRLASEVVAIGFPVGGDDVSATRGVVSRILVGGLTDNLCVQIDAAINPGNSGGPVYDGGGQLVGVAFSGLMNANNVGYIIPLPVLRSFIVNFRQVRARASDRSPSA